MARIRTIKPEFWTNERVMECSMAARLLFIGMWNFADDLGRLALAPKTLKAQIMPSDDITSESILGMVQELSANGLVLLYEVDGRQYVQITGWQHQRIDKPQPGRCPPPVNGYSESIRGMVATEGKVVEGSGKEGNSEPIGSGPANADPRTRLFDEGLKKLAELTGKGPDSCRTFAGLCLKTTKDDASVVLAAIDDAYRNRVADAGAWIMARLKAKPADGGPVEINWDMACQQWVRIKRWPRGHGSDPESPACRAPPDILEKHGIRPPVMQ